MEPSESKSNNINNSYSSPPVEHARYTPLCRAKETNIKSLELFIENIEKDIFDTAAVRNAQLNISREEKEALKLDCGIIKQYVFKARVLVLLS